MNSSYIGNFTSFSAGDTKSKIEIKSSDDIDLGDWLMKIEVVLGDYITYVPKVTEYLWLKMESCIVN